MQEVNNIRPKLCPLPVCFREEKTEVLVLKVKLDLQTQEEFFDKQQDFAEVSLLQVNPLYQQFTCS